MLAHVLAVGCVSLTLIHSLSLTLSLCLFVCLLHAGIVLKWLHRLSWFFCVQFFSTYSGLYFNEIMVSPKKVLSSGTAFQTLNLETLAIARPPLRSTI